MKKIKNNLMYVLCVSLTIISSVLVITAFYLITQEDSVNISSSNESQIDNTQNIIKADNQNYFTTQNDLSQEMQDADTTMDLEYQYKVTVFDNSVVVFLSGKSEPYIKLFIDLKNIPDKDKQLLEKGIYAKNRVELIRILEDYDS